MLRYGVLVGWVGLLALTVACTPKTETPDTRPADIKAVKDLEAAWAKDTKDVDKFATYYSEDAAFLRPNAPALVGMDNIKSAMRPLMADPNFALTFQSTRVEASKGGDFVYTIGSYTMTVPGPKGKKPTTDKGKYLTVYAKQLDGSWKAVADMYSSDLPAPGAAQK